MKINWLICVVLALVVASAARALPAFRSDGQSSLTVVAGQIITIELYCDYSVSSIIMETIGDSAEVTGIAGNLWMNPGFDWDLFTDTGTIVNSDGTLVENATGKTDFGSPKVSGVLYRFDYTVPDVPADSVWWVDYGGTNRIAVVFHTALRLTMLATDSDGDGVPDAQDNCPDDPNPEQSDYDEDGVGRVCDNCPRTANSDQEDRDSDGLGDACDCPCVGDVIEDGQVDLRDLDKMIELLVNEGGPAFVCCLDRPGFCGDMDNNLQTDLQDLDAMVNLLVAAGSPFIVPCDYEGLHIEHTGDYYEISATAAVTDSDDDGVPDDEDNCPDDPNPEQSDYDEDGVGRVCDNCPRTANSDQEDRDGDGLGDACDCLCPGDIDDSGWVTLNDLDILANVLWAAGGPFVCCWDPPGFCGDFDDSGQTTLADLDAMVNLLFEAGTPFVVPCEYEGLHIEHTGDYYEMSATAAVTDSDDDGVPDDVDNCPDDYNPDQADSDGDGIGNECEECPCLGDLDDSGQITLGDLDHMVTLLWEAGTPFVVPVEPGNCADFDESGYVTLKDLTTMMDMLWWRPYGIDCEFPWW